MSDNRDDDADDLFEDLRKAFREMERIKKPKDLDETRADTQDLETAKKVGEGTENKSNYKCVNCGEFLSYVTDKDFSCSRCKHNYELKNPVQRLKELSKRRESQDLETSQTLDPENIETSQTLDPGQPRGGDLLDDDLLDPESPIERKWMSGYDPNSEIPDQEEPIIRRALGTIRRLYRNKKGPIKKVIYGTVLAGFIGGLYCLNAKEIDKTKEYNIGVNKGDKFSEAVDSDLRKIFTWASEFDCPSNKIEGAWNLELRVKNQGVKEFSITRDHPICVILAYDIKSYFDEVWKNDGRTGLNDGTYKISITFKKP